MPVHKLQTNAATICNALAYRIVITHLETQLQTASRTDVVCEDYRAASLKESWKRASETRKTVSRARSDNQTFLHRSISNQQKLKKYVGVIGEILA